MNTRIPFDDDIGDLLGGEPRPHTEKPVTAIAPYTGPQASVHVQACAKCGGSGYWNGRRNYPCFACKGKGKIEYRTSPEQRAKARARSAAKVADRLAERAAWQQEHADVCTWLRETAERQRERAHQGKSTWDFPVSLDEALAQYGALTDGQLAAAQKCMAKDIERKAQWAADAAKDNRNVALDASKLCAAFATRRANKRAEAAGVAFLRLVFGNITVTPDRQSPSDVWFKRDGVWIGKTENGRFKPFRACTADDTALVQRVCADPAAAAKAHGLDYSFCSCCGLPLTNPESIARGIGPICAESWGF